MFKNVAAKFIVFAFDTTTGAAKTGDGANITAYVSKDYAAVTVLADTSATEMEATNAKGYYLFDAAQGETNGDVLLVSAKSATANISVVGAPAVIFTRPTTGWLAPTTAGRTLDVTATGGAGIDWANVEAPTTTLALTGTTIAVTQKVDVDTIKTNPVVNGGTITFPTTATLASTTNITAGTITTVTTTTTATNVTTVNGLAANVITAASMAADAGAEIAAAVWDLDATAHQTQGTFGQAIGDPVADTNTLFKAVITDATGATVGIDVVDLKTQIGTAGAGLTVLATQASVNTIDDFVDTEVAAILAAVDTEVAAIKAKTDSLTFTVAGSVDANIQQVNDVTVTGNGQAGTEWGP